MSFIPPPQLKYKLALVDIQENRLSRLAIWRAAIVVCITISIFVLGILPYWQIEHQSQIIVKGNKLVSKNNIYQNLDFAYPQYIWTVNGGNLAQKVVRLPSVAEVRINKSLIPPQLIVFLQEKNPVALATLAGNVGFLDSNGQWIAQKNYDNIHADFALPKLKVINYQVQYQSTWQKIYQLILSHQELKITELKWSQSGNLFLQTKIGKVALGSNSTRLKKQFTTMLKLQTLPKYIENNKIDYIDLSSSDLNLIQKY